MSENKKPIGQVVLLEPLQEGGTRALLIQGDQVETGIVGNVKEGQPLNGRDLIYLGLHPQSPLVYNLMERTSFSPDAPEESTSKGPAKVTSRAYRSNYDSIFRKKDVDALPN